MEECKYVENMEKRETAVTLGRSVPTLLTRNCPWLHIEQTPGRCNNRQLGNRQVGPRRVGRKPQNMVETVLANSLQSSDASLLLQSLL